jgi:hypothetical protein
MMIDTNARLRSCILAALKLAASTHRLDIAEHLLQALEVLDANGTAHPSHPAKSPLH